MTVPERKLWYELKRLVPYSWQIQKILLDKYIVDFYCDKLRLIIEVDGAHHKDPEQLAKDKLRDIVLYEAGYKVIRVANWHVLNNLDNVLQDIRQSACHSTYKDKRYVETSAGYIRLGKNEIYVQTGRKWQLPKSNAQKRRERESKNQRSFKPKTIRRRHEIETQIKSTNS